MKKSYIEKIGEKFMKDFIKDGVYPPKPLKPLKNCVHCGQPIIVSSKLKQEGHFNRDYYYHLCDRCYRCLFGWQAHAEGLPPDSIPRFMEIRNDMLGEEMAYMISRGYNLPQHKWVELNKSKGDGDEYKRQ